MGVMTVFGGAEISNQNTSEDNDDNETLPRGGTGELSEAIIETLPDRCAGNQDEGPIERLPSSSGPPMGVGAPYVAGTTQQPCGGEGSTTEGRPNVGVWEIGQRFQATDPVTGDHISGKIIGKASTGRVRNVNKDCYHIERDSDGLRECLNFGKLQDLTVVSDDTEMMVLFNNAGVALAKEK